jgi:protein-disulfide isomerase
LVVALSAWMGWLACHPPDRGPAVVAAAACDTTPTGTLASWRSGSATWEDVEARVSGEVRAAQIDHELHLWELRSQALDDLVVESLLEAEAKKAGFASIGGWLAVEVDAKVDPPREKEVEEFYSAVAGELGGASYETVAPMLRDELVRRGRMDRYGDLVAKLRQRAELQGGIPYPNLPRVEIPVEPSDPVDGAPDALVTIVEFGEYQCPYCGRVKPTLDKLLRAYPGKVRLVFKDFPLAGHARALPAAIAAACAGEQGKYWKLNEVLLQNQGALEDLDLARHAAGVGLDVDEWQACLASGRVEPGIEADFALGQAVGVSATPTFYVNGILVSGAQPYERFAALVDRELSLAAR